MNDEKNRPSPDRLLTPGFRAIVASQACSLLGLEILQFVLPLHLLNLTGSGALYGGVLAAGFVPYVALSPVGGILADRTRKRGVMVTCDAALALVMALYLATASPRSVVPVTVAVLMVAFAAQALYHPCVQSAVPLVVAPGRITQATAVANQVSMVTGIAGPVVGGLVFGFFGLAPIVAVSVVAFSLSAALRPQGFGIESVPRLLAASVAGIALMALALAAGVASEIAFAAVVAGDMWVMACCTALSIAATSYLQREAPATLVGKVMALAMMSANLATPAGQMGYGVAFDVAPAWGVAALAGAATLVVAAALAHASTRA